MLTIGSRSKPSALKLVLIVILVIAASDYVSTSLHSGDWTWSSILFADSPSQVFRPAAPGLRSGDRPLSGVDHFVVRLEDLHAWMNHVLGLEQSAPIISAAFGWLVGTSPGAGMSLIIVFCGAAMSLVGLCGYAFREIRLAEDLLPDHQYGNKGIEILEVGSFTVCQEKLPILRAFNIQ